MAEGEDQESKTEEASAKKLEDAKQKGDVAKSMDVPPLLVLAATFGVIAMAGPFLLRQLAGSLLPFISNANEISLDGHGGVAVMEEAVMAAAPTLLLVVVVAAFAGVAGNLMQHGFIWTTEKLKPDLNKLSPMAGFKRLFGLDGFVQFLKSVLKISVVSALAYYVLKPRIGEISQMSSLQVTAILPLTAEILRTLFFAVIALMTVTAGADWVFQRFRFLERMKMSKEEMKQEYKNAEGDPLVKAKLKQMRMEKARRRMMQNVPKATVVITNPTHYAVALFYEMGGSAPPVCLAKGLDAVALKIREIAGENDVPIVEDPPLARALYAAIDVDEVIPPAHYEAVAKIIGFIMSKAAKPKARPLRPSAL